MDEECQRKRGSFETFLKFHWHQITTFHRKVFNALNHTHTQTHKHTHHGREFNLIYQKGYSAHFSFKNNKRNVGAQTLDNDRIVSIWLREKGFDVFTFILFQNNSKECKTKMCVCFFFFLLSSAHWNPAHSVSNFPSLIFPFLTLSLSLCL